MSIFCIADTHLSQSVPKPMDVFGCRWLGYTEKLIKGWKSVVTDDDTVIVPGDISWGLTLEEAEADLILLHSLPGKKIIGRGNHDYWWQSASKISKLFENDGIDSISLLHHNAFLVEDKVICGSRGWFSDPKSSPDNADPKKIHARELLRAEMSFKEGLALGGGAGYEMVAFFHFPPVYRDFIDTGIIDLMKEYGIKRCYYGHLHGQYDIPRSFLYDGISMTIASSDYLNFIPLKI